MTTRLRPTSVEEVVAGAVSLASPPPVYSHLMEVLEDPRSGQADVAGVLQDDLGLVARLLRLVNSSIYGFPKRIDSVAQAVTLLGTTQVRDLALATSVMRLFEGISEQQVDLEGFWSHSIACGAGARVLGDRRRHDNVERFFVAGLLHDIGRLVLFQGCGDEMGEAIEMARATGRPLLETEREVLGFDHARVGATLLRRWNFPRIFQEAVGLHHQPERAERFPEEVAAVHVADLMATALGLGESGSPSLCSFDSGAWRTLRLEVEQVPNLVSDLIQHHSVAVDVLQARMVG